MTVGDKIIINGQLYKFCIGSHCDKCSFYTSSHCGKIDCQGGYYERDDTPITTEWEQVRIKAAIAAMQGILSNHLISRWRDGYTIRECYIEHSLAAKKAVAYANALVEELKNEK